MIVLSVLTLNRLDIKQNAERKLWDKFALFCYFVVQSTPEGKIIWEMIWREMKIASSYRRFELPGVDCIF